MFQVGQKKNPGKSPIFDGALVDCIAPLSGQKRENGEYACWIRKKKPTNLLPGIL